ncbi:MAG: intradiol ring-cleavage dioxygenase [Rubrivivax sp.]|nr:intradiol ring-cleavage dioxygenase [Rubrivivax sp.]
MQSRRRLLLASCGRALAAAWLATPALASSRRVMPSMTDGPFYPPRRWRAQWSDWDADLTLVREGAQTHLARGEHLGLSLVVADAAGRRIDGAEVEIWQCDTLQHYRHPQVPRPAEERGTRWDPGFQGFGAATSDARGELDFRTIRPVPYPGRTPHIHVKLRHASFGEWTSQLFVAGDAGNARDFLWRNVPAEGRAALEMRLARAPVAAAPVAPPQPALGWVARHELIVPD